MKKLIGFVLGLALAVSSVSALEFSVGAKANADYSIITIENGEFENGSTFGAGVSVIGGILRISVQKTMKANCCRTERRCPYP